MQNLEHKNFFIRLIVLCFLINTLTAYFASGYYHADEHFQILEFANYKLGNNPASNMPWEFFSKIRPWILPGFYFISFKFFSVLFPSINNFSMASIFRIESSLFASFSEILFIYAYYISSVAPYFDKTNYSKKVLNWKITSLIISLFWLFPYLAARTSVENFSNSFILLTYSFLIFSNKIPFYFSELSQKLSFKYLHIFILGILLGLTFQIRYQTAFFIIGFYFWILFNTEQKFKFSLFLGLGFLIASGCALLIDYWGYGVFNFTAYNYYNENITHNIVNSFGVEPWYKYIPFINDSIYPQYGILLFTFYFIAVFKYRKNLFIWCSLLFIIAHSLIGHKESRFLFPILTTMIIPSCEVFFDIFYQNKLSKVFVPSITKIVLYTLIILNFIEIGRNALRPSTKNLNTIEFLQTKLDSKTYYGFHTDIRCESNNESAGNYCGLYLNFYSNLYKKFIHLNSLDEFNEILNKTGKPQYLYIGGKGARYLENDFYQQKCIIIYNNSIIPNWVYTKKSLLLNFILNRTESGLFLRCTVQ